MWLVYRNDHLILVHKFDGTGEKADAKGCHKTASCPIGIIIAVASWQPASLHSITWRMSENWCSNASQMILVYQSSSSMSTYGSCICIVLSFVPLSCSLLNCMPVHGFLSHQLQLNQPLQLASNFCSQL